VEGFGKRQRPAGSWVQLPCGEPISGENASPGEAVPWRGAIHFYRNFNALEHYRGMGCSKGKLVTDTSSILVVDDEADSLSLLTGILAAGGYHVRSANSGKLALASVAAWPPELIVLDIRMPGMDGFEVCRQLKAADEFRNVPVIFISAASEVEERVKGLALGAVDYVSKPFQREELLARVRTHLELGRLRNHLEKQVSQRTAELRNTLNQLRESEERFRNMADTAPVMIWISGPDNLRTFFNKTWLTFTGRTLEQEQGNAWTEGVHLEDVHRCIGGSSSIGGRQDVQMEYRLRRADGEFRWVLDKGAPRFTPSGAFTGYIGSAIDITELKRIQQEALSREKLASLISLTRGIAHDFNNMIGGIIAQSELAESGFAEGSSPAEEVRQIKAIAIRASEVVRELMIYSRQEEAKLESVDLSELAAEMAELLKVSVSKHATLRLDLSKGIPAVRGNAAQIRQLLMNLIINASQALGEKDGVIHVKTSLPGGRGNSAPDNAADSQEDYVRLEVADTGCGMTEEEKAKIFDPFFTTKPQGHGLGLAVVQGIVHSHGGTINVVSTPGMGTTIEVLFRCGGRPDEIMLPATYDAATEELPTISGTILLVEDEDPLRLATATALQKRGLSVLTAPDGLTAVQIFRAQAADIGVVLLDLTLPGISGHEALRQIREIKPEVKFLLTSAYDSKHAEGVASGKGTARFLQKPYQFPDLIRGLHEALSETPRVRSGGQTI
jgi:PAS domain S-box-containing protein